MSGNPTHSDWQFAEANRRKAILENAEEMVARGKSLKNVARQIGTPLATLWRWKSAYGANHDFNALLPRISPGRRSVRQKLEAEIGAEALQSAIATVKGHNLDMNSNSGAWRYCSVTQSLPESIKNVILDPSRRSKHYIPRSLTTQTTITRAERLAFRGRRALSLHGSSTPRLIDVLPGDVLVPDDMTPIWGWWVPWPVSEQYPFGRKVLQGQLLGMVDYSSLCRVAFSLVAREKSSYRSVDIWSFFGDFFEDAGLPRLGFQLEGGSWQGNLIRGQAVESQPGEVSLDRRVGALNGLSTQLLPYHYQMAAGSPLPATLHVWRSTLPKSKPIELVFNNDQRIEGTLWGSLGRDQRRKPFEKAQKIFEACKRGAADPALHFLSLGALSDRLNAIMQYLNQDRMEGENYRGRPCDLWNDATQKHPLLKLPEGKRWLYRRHWAVRKIKGAFLDVGYTDEATGAPVKLAYQNAEMFARLDGEKVAVYFDRGHPERPAEITMLDGEYLCQADYWPGTGAFLARNEDGFKIQDKWKSTVIQSTRTISEHAPSRQVPAEISQARSEARAKEQSDKATPFSAPARASRSLETVAMSQVEMMRHGMTDSEWKAASAPVEPVRALTREEMSKL